MYCFNFFRTYFFVDTIKKFKIYFLNVFIIWIASTSFYFTTFIVKSIAGKSIIFYFVCLTFCRIFFTFTFI